MSDTQTAPAPEADGPVTIKLAKSIMVIDQTVSTVTLQPPTGRHLMKAGALMRVITREETGETLVEINPDGMGKLIGACGNLPVRSVESLSATDFMACSNALMGFFKPTETS